MTTSAFQTRIIIISCLMLVLFFGIDFSACATHSGMSGCGNSGKGSAGGHGGGSSKGTSVGGGSGGGSSSSAPPRACNLTVSPAVVTVGTSNVVNLSWSPQPNGAVTLRRNASAGQQSNTAGVPSQNLSVPSSATSYSDSFTASQPGTITYNLSFSSRILAQGGRGGAVLGTQDAAVISGSRLIAQSGTGGSGSGAGGSNSGSRGTGVGGSSGGGQTTYAYTCTVTVSVVPAPTECNDNVDNGDGEDNLIDTQDPGCHTDGNPNNPGSYDSTDGSETNRAPDMQPSVRTGGIHTVGRAVQVTASARNTGGAFALTNDLVYGYRDVDRRPNYCSGSGNSQCFTVQGRTYSRLGTYSNSYVVNASRTAPVRSFTPMRAGTYEVCAVADHDNDVAEGAAGESNNTACRTISVTDAPANTPPPAVTPGITEPVSLDVDRPRVRRGETPNLTWDTGGRTACTLTGTNGQSIPVTSITGSTPTQPITAETTYTLVCTDPGFEGEATQTIRILPQLQEV